MAFNDFRCQPLACHLLIVSFLALALCVQPFSRPWLFQPPRTWPPSCIMRLCSGLANGLLEHLNFNPAHPINWLFRAAGNPPLTSLLSANALVALLVLAGIACYSPRCLRCGAGSLVRRHGKASGNAPTPSPPTLTVAPYPANYRSLASF